MDRATAIKNVDAEYAFYEQNALDIADKYRKGFVLISGKKIIGHYKDKMDAYGEGCKIFGLGNFIIQNVDYFGSIKTLGSIALHG